jgi:acid phosphatase (class A)
MTTGTEFRGGMPRWDKQCDQPNAEAWCIRPGFSPSAPWGAGELYCVYRSPEACKYIVTPAEEIFDRFERALNARRLHVGALPTVKEIRDLIDYGEKRTHAQEQTIVSQLDRMDLLLPLATLVESKIKPSLLGLIGDTVADAASPLFFAKARYNRVRAYQLLPELTPRFLPDGTFPMHPSFPSGHSTQAHLIVNVLAAVFGAAKAEEKARAAAWEIGKNREIAGLHYPSDTQGGRYLADVLIDEAESNPQFRAARDAVRAEYAIA